MAAVCSLQAQRGYPTAWRLAAAGRMPVLHRTNSCPGARAATLLLPPGPTFLGDPAAGDVQTCDAHVVPIMCIGMERFFAAPSPGAWVPMPVVLRGQPRRVAARCVLSAKRPAGTLELGEAASTRARSRLTRSRDAQADARGGLASAGAPRPRGTPIPPACRPRVGHGSVARGSRQTITCLAARCGRCSRPCLQTRPTAARMPCCVRRRWPGPRSRVFSERSGQVACSAWPTYPLRERWRAQPR